VSNRRPAGRLPEDQAYWEALATRAIAAAFRADAPPWWTRLAEASLGLAAAAVVALVAGAVLLDDGPPDGAESNAIVAALSPEEPMLRSLVLQSTAPPPGSALVNLLALREGER
jgi:hypothetical protein